MLSKSLIAALPAVTGALCVYVWLRVSGQQWPAGHHAPDRQMLHDAGCSHVYPQRRQPPGPCWYWQDRDCKGQSGLHWLDISLQLLACLKHMPAVPVQCADASLPEVSGPCRHFCRTVPHALFLCCEQGRRLRCPQQPACTPSFCTLLHIDLQQGLHCCGHGSPAMPTSSAPKSAAHLAWH